MGRPLASCLVPQIKLLLTPGTCLVVLSAPDHTYIYEAIKKSEYEVVSHRLVRSTRSSPFQLLECSKKWESPDVVARSSEDGFF